MTAAHCSICLDPLLSNERAAHPRCVRSLFGTRELPRIDIDLARLNSVGLAMVGRTSLSGVQRKISVKLSGERATLALEAGAGHFILKPQTSTFPQLPENEHVTMLLAQLAGIEVPPCGTILLSDGSRAYITRRFDRSLAGGVVRKLRQEDFCQLAELPPKDKYRGSVELLFRIVARYASEPGIEALRLYRLVLFQWWTGNGDAHLKNFALLCGEDGIQRLSPAYDLLDTRLVIPNDRLALPLGGKQDGITRRSFLELADYAKLPRKVAEKELARLPPLVERAQQLLARSFLSPAMQGEYATLLAERATLLASA